tara:strand:- start:208 stop:924 length:717 start_codon:yes stop_codon:yes gene_type:complete
MSDDALRALARIDALGDDEERARLLVGLIRRGELELAELKLRVWLHDPAARLAWEGLGEEELPPTLAEIERAQREKALARDPAARPHDLPPAILHRLFGRAWARGLAPLGVPAAARVSLAAFRVGEERLGPELLPAIWPELRRAAERWLEGRRDEVADFDAFQHELATVPAEELRPAIDLAKALAVTLGSMTEIGAAEGAGAALARVGAIWHQGTGEQDLTASDLQAALRRHLPPTRP